MKYPPASAFWELESLLVQIEHLTAEIIAGLHQAQDNCETGLTPELMQKNLLRGKLLYQAQEVAELQFSTLDTNEKEALSCKLKQLKGFDSQLGHLLQAHHEQIRQALQDVGHAQRQVKGYNTGESLVKASSYLEDA